jgi:hypothetical protein
MDQMAGAEKLKFEPIGIERARAAAAVSGAPLLTLSNDCPFSARATM